ncbi:uncharacterized protein LOC110990110 [Acanthaster planci]|uniref:Uncharacterized protein LOC110990110 n=1 Tax=Acanthaster planci TaxID=133434 RepID=A0A8B8A0X6_ACAPL|nr:uncharacterized protein LOC110990110 [Acanthaster planci]
MDKSRGGGDKGGSSFKMAFQIVNVEHPNSLRNTVVFACFEAKDSLPNIQRVLPPTFQQIAKLGSAKWQQRSIRLFCFGDYELLTKLYGICGCNASKAQMNESWTERDAYPSRTIESIEANYDRFLQDGGNQHRAKDVSCSIVHRPLMPIAIDHVILPTLHISLGVFKKLFDAFESACHRVDMQLFQVRVATEGQEQKNYFDYRIRNEIERQQKIQKDLEEKRLQLIDAEDELPLHVLRTTKEDMDGAFLEIANKAFRLQVEISRLEKEAKTVELPFATGPIASSLDTILQQHRVQRQAYHGKAFVGNHVHKCCEPLVIKALTAVPLEVAEKSLTDDIPLAAHDKLRREAAHIGVHFQELFMKFADVHKGINHSSAVTQQQINCIETSIRDFMAAYRQLFPDLITPKLHLLEDHAVEQLTRSKVGFGLLNEQGGELIHTEFNRTGRVVQGMRGELQKLMAIMRRHHVATTPERVKKVLTPLTKVGSLLLQMTRLVTMSTAVVAVTIGALSTNEGEEGEQGEGGE